MPYSWRGQSDKSDKVTGTRSVISINARVQCREAALANILLETEF